MRSTHAVRMLCGVLVLALGALLAMPAGAAAAGVTAGDAGVLLDDAHGTAQRAHPRTFSEDHAIRQVYESRSARLTAQTVPVTVVWYATYLYGGDVWLDGQVQIPPASPTNMEDVIVWLRWEDASHNLIEIEGYYAQMWTQIPGLYATFSFIRNWSTEPGVTHYHVIADGEPSTLTRYGLSMLSTGSGTDATGRYYDWTLTNNRANRVVGVIVSGIEDQGVGNYVDVVESEFDYPDRLEAWESINVRLRGYSPVTVPPTVYNSITTECQPDQPTIVVYRFYKPSTGTHFYTASESEKNTVITTLSHVYQYEGPSYRAYGVRAIGTMPLYRFYNTRAGTHFYTVSPDEAQNVIATLSHIYNFEGIAYFVADGWGSTADTVFRFYRRDMGVHFYTSSVTERDNVINTLGHVYNYEGPSYNVPD